MEHLELVVLAGDGPERRPAAVDAADGQEQTVTTAPAEDRGLQDIGPDHRPQPADRDISRGEDPDGDQCPEVLRLAQSHDCLQRQGHPRRASCPSSPGRTHSRDPSRSARGQAEPRPRYSYPLLTLSRTNSGTKTHQRMGVITSG